MEFRTDDICGITSGGAQCFKVIMNSDPESSAYEEISDTRYYVVISVALAEYTYEFEKVSDSTINWILYPSGQIATLNKQ